MSARVCRLFGHARRLSGAFRSSLSGFREVRTLLTSQAVIAVHVVDQIAQMVVLGGSF